MIFNTFYLILRKCGISQPFLHIHCLLNAITSGHTQEMSAAKISWADLSLFPNQFTYRYHFNYPYLFHILSIQLFIRKCNTLVNFVSYYSEITPTFSPVSILKVIMMFSHFIFCLCLYESLTTHNPQ